MSQGDYKYEPRSIFEETDSYYIKLDKRWKLDELSEFSRNYEQSYYAALVIEALKKDSALSDQAKISLLSQMSHYPWRGGYSTVQFYYGVKRIVGKKRQPTVKSIRYSSPGFIELAAIQEISINLGVIVGSVCGTITAINTTYNQIYKGIRDRKLNNLSLEKATLDLAKEHHEFLRSSISAMGGHLNLKGIDQLISASGNEFRALKILLSMYRRIRILAKYQEEKKIFLPKSESENKKPDVK